MKRREGTLRLAARLCLTMGILMCVIAYGNYIFTGRTSLDGLGHVSVDFTIAMTVVCVMLYHIAMGVAEALRGQERIAEELGEIRAALADGKGNGEEDYKED